MATARFSLTLDWPMNSPSRCGRSFSSKDESSSTGAAETRRSRLSSKLGVFLTVATGRIVSGNGNSGNCELSRTDNCVGSIGQIQKKESLVGLRTDAQVFQR